MHPFTAQLLNQYATHSALLGSAGVNAVTCLTGLGDLAFGERHDFNSGEIPQNMMVAGFVPLAGSLAGAAVGGLGHMGRARMKYRNRPANGAIVEMKSNDGRYESNDRFQPTRDINPEHMGRDLAIGSTIGTAASAVPAIGYMINDQPQEPQTLGQALSMKDRAELNDLLDTHSDGAAF